MSAGDGREDFRRALRSPALAQFSPATVPGELAIAWFYPPTTEALMQVARPLDPWRVDWIREWDDERMAHLASEWSAVENEPA